MNNLQDRWLGPVEVQAGVRSKRVAPWRAEENDNQMIGGGPPRAHEVLVTAGHEFDRCAEVRDIPGGQVEHGGAGLQNHAPFAREISQEPGRGRTHDPGRDGYANSTIAARPSDDLGNVMPDLIPERVFDGLQTSTRQNADTAFIPLLRRHTVEMNVVGVIEAVTSILLDFP